MYFIKDTEEIIFKFFIHFAKEIIKNKDTSKPFKLFLTVRLFQSEHENYLI